ncbi:glycosyltransferase family 2 protein [Patescibacteria group bacterium]|nr:glycosyltransferase family 2 protein [Patescibacteria group bacterium]
MGNKELKIAIIIVCYNGREYLPDCLNSLKKQTLLPNEIVVVDNASTDGSQEFLSKFKSQGLGFKVILNNRNNGFAKANNQGIEAALGRRPTGEALKNNPAYIFLLNQDTVCRKDCLEKLAKAGNSFKNVFAFQPLVLCWPASSAGRPEKHKIQTAGDKIHYLGFGYCGDYKKPITQLPNYPITQLPDITYASGAAMFIKAQALEKVGLMDEDLFLYHEDLDICLRARFLGYQIKLVSQAIVYHKYTQGIPKHRWYWSERNRLITLLKFYKIPTLILILPAWLFMELGVLVYSLITGWFALKIKSYFTILLQIPKTLKKRRKIQKTRKITDRRLAQYLEPKFDFAGLTHPLLKYIVNPVLGFYWQIIRRIIFW